MGIKERLENDVVEARKALATTVTIKPEPLSAVPPILSYCCASILMTMVNKFVVSGANFSMNLFLLAMQSFFGVVCVIIAKRMGIVHFRRFSLRDAEEWLPISILLVGMTYTGSKSLQFLSIPVYTIFKNLTIILIAYGEVIWFEGTITRLSFISFILMVLSSVIAAWSDISATTLSIFFSDDALAPLAEDHIGYAWMMINCLASATYVLAMRKRIKVTGFSDWDSMFYNNLLCVPILVVASFVLEDWGTENISRNFPRDSRGFLFMAIAFSGAAAVAISYSTAWCIRATSSTTYSMVGALNKLPMAASGMLFFGDSVTPSSISAVCVGFLAGLLYSWAKNNQKKGERKKGTHPIIPLVNRTRSSSPERGSRIV